MGRSVSALERQAIFWGKFRADGPRWLPLAAHCLDVGLVFRALCDLKGIRRTLEFAAGSKLTDQQLDRLSVLAMLHDMGKANLGFQRKVFRERAPQAGHIRELAPFFDMEIADAELQEALASALPAEMAEWFEDGDGEYSYFLATFSHHGRPLRFKGERRGTYEMARTAWWRPHGPWDPMQAVAEITAWSRKAFPEAFLPGEPLPAAARFHHRYAGLLMLADWIGSHDGWFPVQPVTCEERLAYDRRTIPQVLAAIGLHVESLRERAARGPADFRSRFPFDPRPLQAAVDSLDPGDPGTRLVIAESETGSGKTEAALNWFFKLFTAGEVDGLYFALPTRVAARELYTRIYGTMERWFPDPAARPVTVLAVPGYPQVDGVPPERLLPREEGVRWQDDPELRRRERQWAVEHPKRFLAATVAVGTIDQALLSAVQTAHAHLRSICLDRSLLVVDEVHASDVYMSRLLDALLEHHCSVGGRAMLLSATLGSRARRRFARRAAGRPPLYPDLDTARRAPYPSITLLDGQPIPVETGNTRDKEVVFEQLALDIGSATDEDSSGREQGEWGSLLDRLLDALSAGARVVVVLNTVARANSLLRAMEAHPHMSPDWLFRCRGVVCPHHGRFAPADRAPLDRSVSQQMGPDGPSGPLLLVGTQTLEQSLDIDCDFMVSDLAPADVLLQRIGRLHRHARSRPPGFETPRCLVLAPAAPLERALDEQGHVAAAYRRRGYGSVYEDLRVLERTRRALAERPVIRIPTDNRWLVEAATHPDELAALTGERWERHGQKVEGTELARTVAATYAAAVYNRYFGEFEFSEAGGRVAVRLGVDSLQLPLHRPLKSPFGELLREMVVPGHLAPPEPDDIITVQEEREGIALLRCGERSYRYSRYGLEEAP